MRKPEWKKTLEEKKKEKCPECGGYTNPNKPKRKQTSDEYPEFDDTHSA